MSARGEELQQIPPAEDGVCPRTPADDAEQEFAQMLKSRSVAAWELLFEAHFDNVYRYALGRLFRREPAEDAAAATFDRALSMIENYSYRGRPILAWLYGIARNVVNETRRTEMRQRGPDLLESLFHHRHNNGTTDAVRVVHTDDADYLALRIDLQQAMRRLTAMQREVVILRYFAGLSAAEAGQVVGRPETAVYALQARALGALRRQLT